MEEKMKRHEVEYIWCEVMRDLSYQFSFYSIFRPKWKGIIDKIRYKYFKSGPLVDIKKAQVEYERLHKLCLNVQIED
jgi:hypothetical protein